MIKKLCDRCKSEETENDRHYFREFQKVYIYDLCQKCYIEYKELLKEFVNIKNQTTGVKQDEQEKTSNT